MARLKTVSSVSHAACSDTRCTKCVHVHVLHAYLHEVIHPHDHDDNSNNNNDGDDDDGGCEAAAAAAASSDVMKRLSLSCATEYGTAENSRPLAEPQVVALGSRPWLPTYVRSHGSDEELADAFGGRCSPLSAVCGDDADDDDDGSSSSCIVQDCVLSPAAVASVAGSSPMRRASGSETPLSYASSVTYRGSPEWCRQPAAEDATGGDDADHGQVCDVLARSWQVLFEEQDCDTADDDSPCVSGGCCDDSGITAAAVTAVANGHQYPTAVAAAAAAVHGVTSDHTWSAEAEQKMPAGPAPSESKTKKKTRRGRRSGSRGLNKFEVLKKTELCRFHSAGKCPRSAGECVCVCAGQW